MRGLRRILWNVMTVGSLVLCVALAGLWVRSYWVSDELVWLRAVSPGNGGWDGPAESRKSVQSRRGGLLYSTNDLTWVAEPVPEGLHYDSFAFVGATDTPHPADWEFCGFARFDVATTNGRRIPLYFLTVLAAAVPLGRLCTLLRHARRTVGTCARCGYDLRATPDRCSECGPVEWRG